MIPLRLRICVYMRYKYKCVHWHAAYINNEDVSYKWQIICKLCWFTQVVYINFARTIAMLGHGRCWAIYIYMLMLPWTKWWDAVDVFFFCSFVLSLLLELILAKNKGVLWRVDHLYDLLQYGTPEPPEPPEPSHCIQCTYIVKFKNNVV